MDNSQLAQLIRDSHVDLKTDIRRIHEELNQKAEKADHLRLEERVRTNETSLHRAKGAFALLSGLVAGAGALLGIHR